MSVHYSFALVPALLCSISASALVAVDRPTDQRIPRAVAQVLVGTAGFEPGVAAEWRLGDQPLMARPELFINEDGNLGFGASLGFDLGFFRLPDRHTLTVGPRIAFHNSDESGWEADAMAIWNFDVAPGDRGHHFIEVIGAVGILEDEEDPDKNAKFGASIGLGYGYQF
jgi:hypothetical protein